MRERLAHRLDAGLPVRRPFLTAHAVLGSDDLAWDMVQEALIRLWQEQTPPADVERWLVRTVVHLSLSQRRKIVRRRRHEDRAAELRPECESITDPAALSAEDELRVRVARALEDLPEEYRLVFVQREINGLSYATIAARLGVPMGTVRSRLSRARDTLRHRLPHILGREALCLLCRRDQRSARAALVPENTRRDLQRIVCAGLVLLALCATRPSAQAADVISPPAEAAALDSSGADQATTETRTIIRSTYIRLPFEKEIRRVAVGDPEVLASEPINDREILVLGKEIGRTSVIVWFQDGTLSQYLFVVQRDITLLESALHDIDPGIHVEVALDRDAVLLLGTVRDLATSRLAESAAQAFLDARGRRQQANGQGILSGAPATEGAYQAPTPSEGGSERVRAPANVVPTGKVINLLRVSQLPLRPEEHLQRALADVGGADVRVQRILRGTLPDDAKDMLLLEGSVADQVALVRVLSLASRVFVGEGAELDIRVVADEAGGLGELGQGQDAQQGLQQNGNSGLGGISFGLRGGGALGNRVQRNVGRAKALEAANGRILSFIEVRDLPQVRIDIRLCEINRTRLESFDSQFAVLGSDFNQPSLNPAAAGSAVQGTNAARTGSFGGTDIQQAIGFLAGSFTHQLQISGNHFALDSLLTMLETRGIARTLSQPSLSVLSGEQALFQVGGEVPIQTTETFANTSVVQVSTVFREFGIQLSVRPLVGADGTITLDVVPQIVNPDPELTKVIGQATGTNPSSVAFDSRSLRTSARLRDGQVMVIGGLLSRKATDQVSETPLLSRIPLLGNLFRGFSNQDDQQELVIIVNPVIVREEPRQLAAWIFPEPPDLMESRPAAAGATDIPPASEKRNL